MHSVNRALLHFVPTLMKMKSHICTFSLVLQSFVLIPTLKMISLQRNALSILESLWIDALIQGLSACLVRDGFPENIIIQNCRGVIKVSASMLIKSALNVDGLVHFPSFFQHVKYLQTSFVVITCILRIPCQRYMVLSIMRNMPLLFAISYYWCAESASCLSID